MSQAGDTPKEEADVNTDGGISDSRRGCDDVRARTDSARLGCGENSEALVESLLNFVGPSERRQSYD